MEGQSDPSAVWNQWGQSTPVGPQSFENSAEEARIRGCTCADLDEAECGLRDENNEYSGNDVVGANAGAVRFIPTMDFVLSL